MQLFLKDFYTFIWYKVFQPNTNWLHIVVWFQVFLFNTNNRMVSSNYFYLMIVICLNTVIWFLVPDIGLAVRVFANGPGDLGSIPGRVIPKTLKMVLDSSLLNTQHYKVWIKGKVELSWEGVAPSPTPWCSSYRKGSLQVTLDYGRQLYFYMIFSNSQQ